VKHREEELCAVKGMRIFRIDASRVRIESWRTWEYKVAAVLLLPAGAVFVAILCFSLFVAFAGWRSHPVAAASFLVLSLLVLQILALLPAGFADVMFRRRFDIDLKNGACRLRHVPGLAASFLLDVVENVEIDAMQFKGMTASLAIRLRSRRRPVVVHTITENDYIVENPTELARVLRPAAKHLSQILSCPVVALRCAALRESEM
jgi:hypothetical protein